MQFFADTAEIKDIKKLHAMGLLDGITTNPSLIAKSGRQFKEVIKEICGVVPGPVSAEVASIDYDTMMKEAHVLAKLADNVVVKVPLTVDGLRACKTLNTRGHQDQRHAVLLAQPGAARGQVRRDLHLALHRPARRHQLEGMDLIAQIRTIYDNYDFTTQILAASIRTPNHVTQAALAGADVATIPPAVIYKLADHPLTKSGLDAVRQGLEGDGPVDPLIWPDADDRRSGKGRPGGSRNSRRRQPRRLFRALRNHRHQSAVALAISVATRHGSGVRPGARRGDAAAAAVAEGRKVMISVTSDKRPRRRRPGRPRRTAGPVRRPNRRCPVCATSSWSARARAASASRLSRSTSRSPSPPKGLRTGILDADLYGPSIPKLLGIEGKPAVREDGIFSPHQALASRRSRSAPC